MALLQIVKFPDEFLKKVSKPVTEFDSRLHTLLDDMRETMNTRGDCMGVAGVQVGRLLRLCVVLVKNEDKEWDLLELVNPIILRASKYKEGEEGCISIPGEAFQRMRAHKILVEFQDRNGIKHSREFKGIEAVCVQHEIDHMDGVMINSGD